MDIDEEGRPICEVCHGVHPGWTQEEASSTNSVYDPCLQESGCYYCSCNVDQVPHCEKHFAVRNNRVVCSICWVIPMGELGKSSTLTIVEAAHAQLQAVYKMLHNATVDILRSMS